MIPCDKAIKTSNSFICFNTMFHMLHHLVVILYLSHYYHSQAIKYETNRICECFICMFQGQWHDDIVDAYVYETKCN